MSTSTGPGRPELAIANALRNVGAISAALRHQEVVLRDRQRDASDIGLLERIRANQRSGTWPVMQTMGIESIIAVAMPVTRLVAPGPDVATATPTLPLARA